MSEAQGFEQRLQQATARMGMGMGSAAIGESIRELKQLQREIGEYLQAGQVEKNDLLSELQIAVFNNLACLYEKRGRYRSSLYHLQIAEELENKYFTHKYMGQNIPPSALEKLSTTYSNLSAVQSKLGNYREAILNAEFAIQVFSKDGGKEHRALLPLYYNYSFLLDTLGRQGEASQFALEGRRLAHLHADKLLTAKYQVLLEGLKEKLARRESRKIKELKKHLKGELGVVKGRREIEERFLKMAETIELEGLEVYQGSNKMASSKSNITTLQQYFTAERKHLNKPGSSQAHRRHNSTFSSLNPRKQRNFSLTRHHPTQQQNNEKLPQDPNADLIRNELESGKSNRPKPIPKTFSEYSDLTGKIRSNSNKLNSTMGPGRGEFRIKAQRQRLEQQIDDLSRKNDVLSKIIQKINSTEKDHF